MILSSYERKDSPWVWLQYSDEKGIKRLEKSAVRKDDPDKERKVQLALNRIQARILTHEPQAYDDSAAWRWVPGYIATRYGAKLKTLEQYKIRWHNLEQYFDDAEVLTPAALEREHCFAYVEWRTSQVKEKSGKSPGINTALSELKLLGLIMDEAVARGIALANPARKLKIEREEVIPKPEMTDEEIGQIYAALENEPEWMRRSFHISLHTGLRFGDTPITRHQIRWQDRSILIEKPKGGRRREFAIPLYPSIEAMLREFWDGRQPALWALPPKQRALTGLMWSKFFRRIGLPHLCFHCTRVTFISRGARPAEAGGAGIPESIMMKLVNHASKEVHRIYQRLVPTDALRLGASIPIPSGASAK